MVSEVNIFTIGFTGKNAQKFFEFIRKSNIVNLIDVRLNNVSQLAGFAKRDDLKFFLKELCNAEYIHMSELAPEKEMLSNYRKGNLSWDAYEDKFLNLMAQRHVEKSINSSILKHSCLLCSEHKPHFCHRRLVVEYLNDTTDLNLQVKHLY